MTHIIDKKQIPFRKTASGFRNSSYIASLDRSKVVHLPFKEGKREQSLKILNEQLSVMSGFCTLLQSRISWKQKLHLQKIQHPTYKRDYGSLYGMNSNLFQNHLERVTLQTSDDRLSTLNVGYTHLKFKVLYSGGFIFSCQTCFNFNMLETGSPIKLANRSALIKSIQLYACIHSRSK